MGEQKAAELAERMQEAATALEEQRRADLARFDAQQQRMVEEAREEREAASARAAEAARQHRDEMAAM